MYWRHNAIKTKQKRIHKNKSKGRMSIEKRVGEIAFILGGTALQSNIQRASKMRLHTQKSKRKIEPTKWTWGIRCTTHKFHSEKSSLIAQEIHLERQFQQLEQQWSDGRGESRKLEERRKAWHILEKIRKNK